MRKLLFLLVCIVLAALVSGCVQDGDQGEQSAAEQASAACIAICEFSQADLSDGPCLSDDNPDWNVNDWVCDVAHDPRQPVDNLPENQCREFREGRASHFVEVDPGCGFIRAM